MLVCFIESRVLAGCARKANISLQIIDAVVIEKLKSLYTRATLSIIESDKLYLPMHFLAIVTQFNVYPYRASTRNPPPPQVAVDLLL